MRNLFSKARGYLLEIHRRRLWMRVVACLACVVVFCTTYALILPAITMETSEYEPDGHTHTDECYRVVEGDPKTVLDCPLEVHAHDESCYNEAGDLICGYADFVVHTHDSYCYDEDGNLICSLPEISAHTHTELCYPEAAEEEETEPSHIHTEDCYTVQPDGLICGLEEGEGHTHNENCYMAMDQMVCGLDESEDHIHDESCYETVYQLICPLEEREPHYHTADCHGQKEVLSCGQDAEETAPVFSDTPLDGAAFGDGFSDDASLDEATLGEAATEDTQSEDTVPEPICGKEEIILHTHSEDCYDEEGVRQCGFLEITEHQHTEACFSTVQEEEKILDCPYAKSGSEEDSTEEDNTGEDGAEEEASGDSTYFYEDDTISAEVTLEENETVPEGAVLSVRPVTAEDTGYAYELMKERAEEAVGRETTRIDFYDISFYTPEGEYIPVSDTASVTLRFKTDSLMEADEVAVLHYQDEEEDVSIEPEYIEKDAENNGITALTFQTEGFSVFGIMALADEGADVKTMNNSFTLTYNGNTITFEVEDTEGKQLFGDYKDIIAEAATRYIFGQKDDSTLETDSVKDRIAPVVDGYTYSGATNLRDDANNAIDAGPICSVATGGYQEDLDAPVDGFKFYTNEPVADDQVLPLGAGNYKVTLTYAQNADNFDNRTFAIVNRASGNYALTATDVMVNTVHGLKAQTVAVKENGNSCQVFGNVTEWTFHRQTDGTYTVSTIVTEEDGTETPGYLRFCETSYDSSNDGRGSLTLTDEANATHITVTVNADGRVTMESGLSNINSDAATHNFWCYKDATVNPSQHYLCEIVEAEDYSGSWAIVNKKKDETAGVAMQAGSGGEGNNRAGLGVTVREDEDGSYRALHDDVTVWEFEKQEDGTYYISTTVTSADGTEEKKYLTIGAKGAAVTLGATPQSITVTPGTGDYAGMVRLTNSNNIAVNLFGGTADRGFGSWDDSSENEWQLLCIPSKNYGIVETATNHPSSVINLFDYWVTGQKDADNMEAAENEGINADHSLKFSRNQQLGEYNQWTHSNRVYPGIVEKVLGQDGYPVLAVGDRKSLDYLFNPNTPNDYREWHRNVSGLLQVDRQGYYYYNSAENFAEYDKETNSFTLYDTWGVRKGGTSPDGQFFPFNSMDEVVNKKSTEKEINHYLGLTLTTRFVQKYGGHTTSSRKTDTVFNFAGDDDVWIFIDGVLVADLGGIHDRASVSINFATGEVSINDGTPVTLKTLFENAGSAGKTDWNGDTFADNTYHTLKFFYLERGNTDSNLYLQYNLTEVPLTGIYKVNQYGEAVKGAVFSVYRADKNFAITDSEAVYTGTTDEKGEMIFIDDEGMPYSLSELKNLFGEHFVLKETKAPENYSLVADDIYLYIENGLLLCKNTYESGVWADTTLHVMAPNKLKPVNGDEIDYYDLDEKEGSNGTLFAVVLKYMGNGLEGLASQNNWSPVYGSDKEGYTVVPFGDNPIETVIYTAQQAKEYGDVAFKLSASGAMQLEMQNLPGDVKNYYYMLDNDKKGNTQYTIAYYWTPGSLEDATSGNTVRINADDTKHIFDRVFGASIEVPNIINRMFAQKLNEDGELVNGAKFALYEVKEENDATGKSIIYYKGQNDRWIHLDPDTDGDNKGSASIQGADTKYTYQVDSVSGNITVGDYIIKAIKTAPTLAAGDPSNPAREEGTATFEGIPSGKYYMREIGVPTGYELNSTEVMVLVADDAIYANAGTEDDGVTVARGPGHLVATLSQFATEGDVDNTLSWVYERMRISGESNTFSAYDDEAWRGWKYLKENNTGISGEENEALTTYLEYQPYDETNPRSLFNYAVNPGRYQGVDPNTVRRRLYTTVGWSYYELYQDYDYGSKHINVNDKNVNYTPLLINNDPDPATPMEIAHLFSRSTYVQVTDKKEAGTLEISKIVIPEDKSESYTFTVNLKNAKGGKLAGAYDYKVYDIVTTTLQNGNKETKRVLAKSEEDGNPISGTIESGGTITLKHEQVAVIEKIPAGTRYEVTEEEADTASYITSAVRDKDKPPAGTGTGEKNFSGNVVTGTLYWLADGTTVYTTSTVEYTNVYPSDLTIHKVDGTNHSVGLRDAVFVFYKKEENGAKYYTDTNGTTVWESVEAETVPEKYKLTTDDKGRITLYNIPNDTYYLEEVKAPDGYYPLTKPIEVTVEGGLLTGDYSATETGVTISKNGLILTVPNRTGYQLPNTGGHGTYGYMFCGAALMAGSLIYMFYRRRKGGI